MNLQQFKEHIEVYQEGFIFSYSISVPFSWRGSYDEVAFAIIKKESTRESILENIECALTGIFHGYKGGDFKYNSYTHVHFESDYGSYTDGYYCADLIAEIEHKDVFISQEHRLISLIF